MRFPSTMATNGGSWTRPTGEMATSAHASVRVLNSTAPLGSTRDVTRLRNSCSPDPCGASITGAARPGVRIAALSRSGRHAVAVSGPFTAMASCASIATPSTGDSPVLAAWWRLGAVLLLLLALDVALLALGTAQQLLRLA